MKREVIGFGCFVIGVLLVNNQTHFVSEDIITILLLILIVFMLLSLFINIKYPNKNAKN